MDTGVLMPWWAWGYLMLVSAIFIMGCFFEPKTVSRRVYANTLFASCCSLFCICVFVIGVFNPDAVRVFGPMIVPMTAVGLFWEFTKAVNETRIAERELQHEMDLSEDERKMMLNAAICFNAILVVPGYVAGLMLSARILGGA